MVIAILHPHGALLAHGLARLLEVGREQLVDLARIKVVAAALVNEDVGIARERSPGAHQLRGVMFLPGVHAAQVTREGLLAPRALCRVADGGKGRDGPEHRGVAQGNRQRTVATHAMAGDADAGAVDWKAGVDKLRKLLRDVGVHVIVGRPLVDRGVDVEASARTEVVAVVLALDAGTARGGVRGHDRYPMSGSSTLCTRLLSEVVVRAGEAAQVVEDRDLRPALGSRWQENAEGHGGLRGIGGVRPLLHLASKCLDVRLLLQLWGCRKGP
mmetsp:Transcript_77843/g.176030  ORF Transcript_77843/g.176030 Transcript_77843/m.176030 type:complete len:271 (-) Transcript_77843:140-952(-)